MTTRTALLGAAAVLGLAVGTQADVTIGNFAGGVAETGWGRFNNGVQPLDSSVFAVTDLDTSGDGGALETNLAGFSDSFGYSFATAGTSADFFANDRLVFDLIYRGTPTDINDTGNQFSQVFQVIFQYSDGVGGFPSTAFQQTAGGVPLTDFGGGGTSVGWAVGDPGSIQTVLNVTIDYSSFRDAVMSAGFGSGNTPGVLQFWLSTNDANRPFKAIDNVRLVPEPASLALLGVGGLAMLRRRRHA